jgi:hypothetical protein
MLVPSDMIGAQTRLMHQIDRFQTHQVRQGDKEPFL